MAQLLHAHFFGILSKLRFWATERVSPHDPLEKEAGRDVGCDDRDCDSLDAFGLAFVISLNQHLAAGSERNIFMNLLKSCTNVLFFVIILLFAL